MRCFIGTRTIRSFIVVAVMIPVLALVAQNAGADGRHIHVTLLGESGSPIQGHADLMALPEGGTRIKVVVKGLEPGQTYVSLYYDNHICELEPYEKDDVIGGEYKANAAGVGTTSGEIDDDLDEVNSVSVRLASDFSLLACADVHPTAAHPGH